MSPSAFLTNIFPYRDRLGTLGIVVLVLQRSGLDHRGMTYVHLLRTHTHTYTSAHFSRYNLLALLCVEQPDTTVGLIILLS